MNLPAAPATAPLAPQVNKWLVTASVMLPTLIEVLDTSVANVALQHIQGSLSAGREEVTWVLTSYLVANAVIIPMSGWLARLLGRKRYLLISLISFTISSLLCGLATTLPELVLFRVLQGVGGGGLQPMSQAILMETFPPHQRGLAMAVFGMGVVLGPILGPLLGGYLTDAFSWRFIFFVNLPIGIVALAMLGSFVFDPPYQKRSAKGERVDWPGLLLLTLGIGCLQIVLDKGQIDDWFNAPYITVLSVISGLSLVSLVFWELKAKNPVLDLRIFRNISFAIGNTVMFCGFFAFFGSIVLLPLYLQELMGYTALLAGLVLGPGGLLSLVTMPIAGKLTERVDARFVLATGLAITSASLFYMAGFNMQISFEHSVIGRVIQGLGLPFFFVGLSYVTFAYVSRDQMNNASALFNLLRNLGGSFGVAFVTTLAARRMQFHQHRIIENLSPYDHSLNSALEQLKQTLAWRLGEFGDNAHTAATFIYAQIQREAAAMAYNDAFTVQAWLFVLLLLVIWVMRKPPVGKRGG